MSHNDPRGDVEVRLIRKLVHLDMNDLQKVNCLITALSSLKRKKGDTRRLISEKMVIFVQEIKQLVSKKETIADRVTYSKRR